MHPTARFCFLGLLAALALAALLAPFASSQPDGLETVAERHFASPEPAPAWWRYAPVEEYLFPGISNPHLATGLAGVMGTLILFAAGWGLARLLSARSRTSVEKGP